MGRWRSASRRSARQGPAGRSCAAARPGDRIVVTGSFGGSILGRHFDFQPRVAEALALADGYRLHAGIDASDGLARDLAHLVEESSCGAVVWTDRIPISADAERLAAQLADGSTPLDHALADGEDFELILAVPPDESQRMIADQPLQVSLTVIGEFVSGPGLFQQDPQGRRRRLAAGGFEHQFD